MNDFQELLKEAFVGEEPYDMNQGSVELKASIRKFESQDQTLRILLWSAALVQGGICAWSAYQFWQADSETSTKNLILYATLFLFSMQAAGWAKMFIFSNQKSFSILKDLKRVQLLLLER